jgi:hypothetical protein
LRSPQRLFLIKTDKISTDERKQTIWVGHYENDGCLAKEEHWQEFPVIWNLKERTALNNIDYGLFARIFIDGKTFIVIGGTVEEGTRMLGQYIAENWTTIFDKLALIGTLDNQPFAAIFQLELQDCKINMMPGACLKPNP